MANPELDVRTWDPPRAPGLTGPYAQNDRLADLERWEIPGGTGPEDVVVDPGGRVYTGIEDGRIVRFPPGGGSPELIAETGGRPLGIELDADGRLIVCDADRGLLRVEPGSGAIDVLVDRFEGQPLRFTNNAAVASDGTIYFSDSSRHVGVDGYREAFIAHDPTGRLFAHDPGTGATRLLLRDLYFANGVALSRDERFLVVAETARYQLTRLWLEGGREGERDVLVGNLPGFPDNVSSNGDGVFWVAIANPRDRVLDALLPHAWARRLVARIPERLQPSVTYHGFVLGIDEDGEVVTNLQDPSGSYGYVTGAREHDGWLYLGSLEMDAVARVRLSA